MQNKDVRQSKHNFTLAKFVNKNAVFSARTRFFSALYFFHCHNAHWQFVLQCDLYKLLGVESSANSETIKRVYRQKSLDMDIDMATFRKIYAAYEILSDENKREVYDFLRDFSEKITQSWAESWYEDLNKIGEKLESSANLESSAEIGESHAQESSENLGESSESNLQEFSENLESSANFGESNLQESNENLGELDLQNSSESQVESAQDSREILSESDSQESSENLDSHDSATLSDSGELSVESSESDSHESSEILSESQDSQNHQISQDSRKSAHDLSESPHESPHADSINNHDSHESSAQNPHESPHTDSANTASVKSQNSAEYVEWRGVGANEVDYSKYDDMARDFVYDGSIFEDDEEIEVDFAPEVAALHAQREALKAAQAQKEAIEPSEEDFSEEETSEILEPIVEFSPQDATEEDTAPENLNGELDIYDEITVSFEHALVGGSYRYKNKRIAIPPETKNGTILRATGKGRRGKTTNGDLILKVRIAKSNYSVQSRVLHKNITVPFNIALLGGEIEVQTPYRAVSVNIPANTRSGKTIDIVGFGLRNGSKLGTLRLVVNVAEADFAITKNIDTIRKIGLFSVLCGTLYFVPSLILGNTGSNLGFAMLCCGFVLNILAILSLDKTLFKTYLLSLVPIMFYEAIVFKALITAAMDFMIGSMLGGIVFDSQNFFHITEFAISLGTDANMAILGLSIVGFCLAMYYYIELYRATGQFLFIISYLIALGGGLLAYDYRIMFISCSIAMVIKGFAWWRFSGVK